MNDIDQRCDGFLTWLDARRRDKEPILAELSALNTTAHTIMAISGASPKSLDIVTAAFGLATATYNNWNSRLLIAINQSTVQDVVYSSQGQYRDKIKNFPINDQPTAIYLLRNYLRLCMPTTIEANINTSSTLVQSGNATSATHSTVVKSVTATPTIRHRVNFDPGKTGDLINKFIHPDGVLKPRDPVLTKKVTDFMAKNDVKVSLTSFLRSPEFEDKRTVLARELGLIQ